MLDTDQLYAAGEVTIIREKVVVSPATGKFLPHPPEIFTTEGEWVQEGQTLGEVLIGNDMITITSPFTGWMMGMLAVPGQPVRTGEHLFWIRP